MSSLSVIARPDACEHPILGPLGRAGERDLGGMDTALGHGRLRVTGASLHVHGRAASLAEFEADDG